MRVAQVTPYSWSRPGGVRAHVGGLTRVLLREGIEVDVIGPDGRDGGPALDDGDEISFRSVGRSIPIRDSGSIVPVALGPLAAARTASLVRGGGYDLVHVHEPMIPAVALTACLAAEAPLVGTFHMFASRPRWYRPFAPLARRVIPRRIAVSEAARWHVARTVPGDYRIIPNGIPYDALASQQTERADDLVLFVGRPEPRKGLPALLEAFSRLTSAARLEIAGATEDDLADLGHDLPPGLRGRIRALGVIDDEQLFALLARAALVCVPSLQGESFGMVLVEAMAAGAPVVASAVPGYSSVLSNDEGRLVPPGDAAALAAALDELLADGRLRREMGERGRSAARRYDWSRVGREILDVYESVLS